MDLAEANLQNATSLLSRRISVFPPPQFDGSSNLVLEGADAVDVADPRIHLSTSGLQFQHAQSAEVSEHWLRLSADG